jgi:transposase
MVCAGIDTGKRKLDVAIEGSRHTLEVDNEAHGHATLSAWLRRHRVKRVGIEASGGYEREIVARLRCDRFVVVVLQPAQVRAYAKFRQQRAKNDKIDAALIATCTAAVKTVHAAPDARLAPLADRQTMIEQLREDIVRFKTRRESCRDARLRGYWRSEIARARAEVRRALRQLVEAVRKHPDLAERLDLIASIAGLGVPTALAIVLRMPEIGRLDREQIAALAGLAPYDDDSGEREGLRHIAGGRARLRKSLYCAALAAAFRWNPQIQAIYRRLTAAGKPHKVALVACARKLLIYANTIVQRGTPWQAVPPRPNGASDRPFLGSTASAVSSSRPARRMMPRADAVKAGRRSARPPRHPSARPRLDGAEHGVILQLAGTS